MSVIKAGYCDDDNSVFLAYTEGEVSVSTHLTNDEVDEVIENLKKAKKKVAGGTSTRKRPN